MKAERGWNYRRWAIRQGWVIIARVVVCPGHQAMLHRSGTVPNAQTGQYCEKACSGRGFGATVK